jgi:hypothetical protein
MCRGYKIVSYQCGYKVSVEKINAGHADCLVRLECGPKTLGLPISLPRDFRPTT